MSNSAKYRIAALISAMLLCLVSAAQNRTVKAQLLDRSNGEPLPYATVSIIPAGSKTASKFVLSTSDGKVELTGVKKGSYTFKVELMGYKTYSQEIAVADGPTNLGTLMIETDAQLLNAATVSDVGNPIVVKKDTIEYNASSFKTSDNDMLLDLLKKLPGIEVEQDGTITANGETIKKITIDGKTFFLDDPQLATKNIPSKVIEKVKVVEKKSEQAQFTGIDDGEEETIIDLSFKKGMFKGWFGNVMAGGGHDVPSARNATNDWRYQGAGFVGNFTDKQQISVVVNANNTNNRGFNDLAGNMMGNMRGGGMGGRGMGGGWSDSGITTSWMAGINGAWSLLDGRMDLGGNYLYNGSRKNLEEENFKDTYVSQDETLRYYEKGTNFTKSDGHRIGVRLEHKFSDNTSIIFEPRFNFGYGSFSEQSEFETKRDKGTVKDADVNEGTKFNGGDNRNWTASGWGLLRQKLGKEGRTMTVNLRYDFSGNKLNGTNNSKTVADDGTGTMKPTEINQTYNQHTNNASITTGVTYTEPLWRNWYIEANYSYTFRKQDSDKDTYGKDGLKDPTYCRDILNKSHAQRAGANIMYQKDKFRAQLGFSANPTKTDNYTNGKTYKSNIVNWAPQAMISYDMTENSNIRLFYRGMSSQPSTSQLMPVPDNSNPTNISLGNPYLLPYFTHRLRGMFRYTNKKTFTSVNAFLNGNIINNPISSTSWYDADGTQFRMPFNGRDSYNADIRVMVNSPIAKSKFSIFVMTRLGYNNSNNFIKTGDLNMTPYYIGGDKFNFDYEEFHNDIVNGDLGKTGKKFDDVFSTNTTQTFQWRERIRFTFRSDLVELTAGFRTSMNRGWYSISSDKNNCTWSNQVDGSMNWTIPGGVNIISQVQYNWYHGYTTPQESNCVLNAEISKLLFKNKFTLSIKGYDLLAQARGINISDTDNYHSEVRNNTLGRYIILSLTYRFGTFNKDSAGGNGHGRMMGRYHM